MSLNWKEINLVLQELQLDGCHIQQIFQRDYRNIYFQMYRPGETFYLRICLEQGKTRIHSSPTKPRSRGVQPRFSQFLRARIRGGKIEEAGQVGEERIIRLKVVKGGEISLIFIRLWSSAGNIIVCDENMEILDVAYRKPGRRESSGEIFTLPEAVHDQEKRKKIEAVAVRPPSPGSSFQESIAAEYGQRERDEERLRLLKELKRYYSMRENSFSSRLKRISAAEAKLEKAHELSHMGNLILSNIWKITKGDDRVEVEDFREQGMREDDSPARPEEEGSGNEPGNAGVSGRICIELDPGLSPGENAELYFSKAGKIRSRSEHLQQERENVEGNLKRVRSILSELESEETSLSRIRELHADHREESGGSQGGKKQAGTPGLEFISNGFKILVGRTSRENDSLLRRHTRGNDTWIHTRDYPGGYVFIKQKSGKSVPLDVLLDAGNLALHFSKAKNNGQADMYYTQVKYLRRPKQGKTGLVLPTQEKNLFIKADESRLNRLLKGGNE
ncbi:NFACT RNA binding domain-containing protein [Salinispira pacifica]|uniref:Fibronectin/fibrinogen-binding protein n=1 Tax=Salinispira pacifica TaxID=1307761 RepID=V5WIK7_9SPIO|nr:NFACT RNA binding domain-containing protein [Salinispira pacifica]AHC14996.1 Fibronectin/fibrinogen-binding protein [Salinispira pacifica]